MSHETGPVRILGHAASINVRKVLWTCDEAGIPHMRKDRGSTAPFNTPDFLAVNPHGLIPVIDMPGCCTTGASSRGRASASMPKA